MKVTLRWAALAAGVAAAAMGSAPAAFAQQATVSVRGIVVDAAGRPAARATVTITDGRSGSVEVALTDAEGRFLETGLRPGGPYTITAVAENGVEGRLTGLQLRAGNDRALRLVLGSRIDAAVMSDGGPDLAPAQTTDTPSEIVVTGTRGALASSLGIQRNANSIVSAASADAMGRFTDENAAEAARRLPGVSVLNNRGEGRFVSVRGAEPSFVGFSVNGINLPSQEDDRSVALDVVPSEQLARIEVFKSRTAAHDAEGIGGRVNLVTKSPLDYGAGFALFEGALGLNEQNRDMPWRGSGTVGHVFGADQQIGVLVSASYSTNPRGFESVEAANWTRDTVDGVDGYYPQEITYHDRLFTNERIGVSGAIEWRPHAGTRLEIGGLFNASNLDEVRERLQFQFEDPTTPGPFGANGTFTSLEYSNHRIQRRFDYVDTNRDTWSGYGHGAHELGPLEIDYRLSYSRAREVSYGPEIILRAGGFNSRVIGLDTLFPTVLPGGGADRNDPALFAYQESGIRTFDRSDAEWAGETNWTYTLGSDLLRAGAKARFREKTNDTQRTRQDAFLGGPLTLADDRLRGEPPGQDSLDYDYGLGFDRDSTLALLAQTDLFRANARSYQDSLLDDYTVREDIYAGYVQYEYLRGGWTIIPGVRVEHTETSTTFLEDQSDGRAVDDPSRYQFRTLEKAYTEFFPSLNVKFDASDELVLRAGAARSISRPKFSDLAGAREIDLENFLNDPSDPIEIQEGNPNLEPTFAVGFDLEASWYFAKNSVFSASLFHKELDGPIYTQRFDETFEGNPAEIQRPVNAGKARITGAEIAFSQQFTFLPGALSGFGFTANATLIKSSVDVPMRSDEDFKLFNQSDVLGNASLNYQKYGLDAQVSLNYRGEMLLGLEEPLLDQYGGAYLTLDAKIKYSPNRRLTFFISAENLTDEPEQIFAGARSRLLNNEHYGRNVFAGVEVNLGR